MTIAKDVINALFDDKRVIFIILFPIFMIFAYLFGAFVVFGSLFFTFLFHTIVVYREQQSQFNKRYNLTLRNFYERYHLPKYQKNKNVNKQEAEVFENEGAGDSAVSNLLLHFYWERKIHDFVNIMIEALNDNISKQLQKFKDLFIEKVEVSYFDGGQKKPNILFIQSKKTSSSHFV